RRGDRPRPRGVVTARLGTVLERDGSVYRVATEQGEIRAILTGKAKRDTARVVVGDRVRLEPEPEGPLHAIVGVEPRTALLERRVPEGRGSRPVAANVDQVFVVTATVDPVPIPQLIDRLLVVAEANEIPAAVVVNKVDLDPGEALVARCRQAGYAVYATSTKSGLGIAEFGAALAGRISVVTGPSGAGKSSLLNRVQPGLRLRTAEISAKVRRGKNTTVSAVMLPLDAGGFLVDTPGFSEVGLWGIDPGELDTCFPEFRPVLGGCRYADCRHRTEPGCSVREAVEGGAVARDRWESYLILLSELENAPEEWE
ncbi:MAG TPA: ribosome small subunit-dependent GTPase A, partial [Gemmatimonadales bacterium]|nr:ribosome small subunit-dependent GTPase A [Gemmatimonadales bacterium]